MEKNKMTFWEELLDDDQVLPRMKLLIKEFFLPYKIDPTKYIANKDASSSKFGYLSYSKNPNCTKSMKLLIEKPSLKALGFPAWFYYAFPDVGIWVADGPGKNIMLDKLNHLPEYEFIDQRRKKIKDKYLKQMIEAYVRNNFNLELTIQKSAKETNNEISFRNTIENISSFCQLIEDNIAINGISFHQKDNVKRFGFRFKFFLENGDSAECVVGFNKQKSNSYSRSNYKKNCEMRLMMTNVDGIKIKSEIKTFSSDASLNELLLLFQILFEELENKINYLSL